MSNRAKRANTTRKKGRSNKRNRNKIVPSRGTAFHDAINGLPLLGKRFEYGHFLYYDYTLNLAGTAGVFTARYFRANDLYDPDATGTGSQPMGFDQAMTFWEQFAVFGAKCSVTFVSTTDVAVRCGIFLSPDTTNPTPVQVMENGLINSRVIAGTQLGNSRSTATINLDVNNVEYFQMKSKEEYFASDKFFGTAASTPTEMVYFGVFAFGITTATNFSVYFDIMLSYDARFQEPRKVANSLHVKNPVPLQPPMGQRIGVRGGRLPQALGVRFNAPYGGFTGSGDEEESKQEMKEPHGMVPPDSLSLGLSDPISNLQLGEDDEQEVRILREWSETISKPPAKQSTCAV